MRALLEPRAGDVRVNLRRGEIGVTEQHLHRSRRAGKIPSRRLKKAIRECKIAPISRYRGLTQALFEPERVTETVDEIARFPAHARATSA